ncbi:NfeD family protein [Microbacterium marinilacus]|uniref:NfeD-like C-terminal domain-containing protein n=1 Tax=Microbacterium marinilacus TaxID=415209 RepID=A0ABP7B2N6_9MICO|nr:NfeD family protein [Microbacterium marinilacus]MBY0688675.1 NfeD family protein [Microbacterium marinilacus]
MDVIVEFAWVGWLVLIALFLAIEIVSGELTFLMLAFGSVAGIVSAFADAPIWLQIIIAAVAAVAFLALLRPPLLRRLRRGADPQKFNVEALVGLRGVVTETVTALAGRVKLVNGDSWSARVQHGSDLPPQTPVVVESIQGATAIVSPAPAGFPTPTGPQEA